MIKAWIVGTEGVIARLDKIPGQVASALRVAVEREAIHLVGYVKEQKLSGQVLRQGKKSSHLRNTVSYLIQEGGAGIMASVGAHKPYAAIHEYGFDGAESVRAHQRIITSAFGRSLRFAVAVNVRSFTRQMHMPERSYLRSSLAENAGRIRDAIEKAVAEGIKQ